MKTLYMKQKVFSIGEKFLVTDEYQRPLYAIEGSFLKIPKEFRITTTDGQSVARIQKKVFSFLPTFYVELADRQTIEIKKELTFIKPKYTISMKDLHVTGNWWDMNFQVTKGQKTIATIEKKWVSWGDTYAIKMMDEAFEQTIVSLVVAIDCVKAAERNNS